MNFKCYSYLTKSMLLGAILLISSIESYGSEKSAAGLSTFRFKIIDKTANQDLAVSKVSFPQGTMTGPINTIKSKDTTYGSIPIKVGGSSLTPEMYIFAITHEKIRPLFVYIISFKEKQNDKLTVILTPEFIDDTLELAVETNKATIMTPTAGIENPIYDATLQIDTQNLNKSKILSLTSFQKERANIMGIIKELAPSLYEAIVAVDPNGTKHIVWNQELGEMNVGVLLSNKDGLPIISVGSLASQIPRNQLKFIIAHELGHYALGHSEPSTSSEKILQQAFSRSKESEADRFAIMQLGANIDDAIAAGKTLSTGNIHNIQSALQANHPLWQERIKHFNELRREREAQRKQPEAINWKEIANNYLKQYGSQ